MRKLVVVAALAGTLLGAGACTDTAPPPVSTGTREDTAERTIFGLRTLLTDRGLMRAELVGDTAYFFDDNTRIEIADVKVTFYASNGAKNATLTSREGTYNTRQNRMEARGDVVVVSEDGRRLTSPQLRFDQVRNEISSDSAFTLTEPGRSVRGIGFVSDPDMNNIRILRTLSGTGGTVDVPEQR